MELAEYSLWKTRDRGTLLDDSSRYDNWKQLTVKHKYTDSSRNNVDNYIYVLLVHLYVVLVFPSPRFQ